MTSELERVQLEWNAALSKLQATRSTLSSTAERLSSSNRRKKEVEKAICRQLTKTTMSSAKPRRTWRPSVRAARRTDLQKFSDSMLCKFLCSTLNATYTLLTFHYSFRVPSTGLHHGSCPGRGQEDEAAGAGALPCHGQNATEVARPLSLSSCRLFPSFLLDLHTDDCDCSFLMEKQEKVTGGDLEQCLTG